MAWDAYKNQKKNQSLFVVGKRRTLHEDTAAELVPGLRESLDDAVDGHFLDVEDGEDGRAEGVHDSLRDLVAGACTAGRRGRRVGVSLCTRVYVRA
jgi:hypothetical protein